MDRLKYFSMFSGIGGFELGIQQSEIPMDKINLLSTLFSQRIRRCNKN